MGLDILYLKIREKKYVFTKKVLEILIQIKYPGKTLVKCSAYFLLGQAVSFLIPFIYIYFYFLFLKYPQTLLPLPVLLVVYVED